MNINAYSGIVHKKVSVDINGKLTLLTGLPQQGFHAYFRMTSYRAFHSQITDSNLSGSNANVILTLVLHVLRTPYAIVCRWLEMTLKIVLMN